MVVEFCPKDLGLTEAQQLKLLKLSGPRYNPTKDTIRMSCNMHDHQAQNKRYLGDLIQKMIAEAKVRIPNGPCLTADCVVVLMRAASHRTQPICLRISRSIHATITQS